MALLLKDEIYHGIRVSRHGVWRGYSSIRNLAWWCTRRALRGVCCMQTVWYMLAWRPACTQSFVYIQRYGCPRPRAYTFGVLDVKTAVLDVKTAVSDVKTAVLDVKNHCFDGQNRFLTVLRVFDGFYGFLTVLRFFDGFTVFARVRRTGVLFDRSGRPEP